MKKFLVVLTILVLVAGFAFADISGKVEATYTIDFGHVNAGEKVSQISAKYAHTDLNYVDATFSLDTQSAGITGENMPYALVEVNASIKGYYNISKAHEGNKPAEDAFEPYIELKTFKIIGEDWSINFLKADEAKTDFAVSAIDSYKFFSKYSIERNTGYFTYRNYLDYKGIDKNTMGVSVTYKGFVAGVGFNTPDLKNAKADAVLEVKTPEFTFGDVTVQAGAGFSQQANFGGRVRKAGASVKVAYVADAVQASVAVDAGRVSGNKKIVFDLAANVKVAPVTVDVYYTTGAAKAYSTKKDLAGKTAESAYSLVDNLSVKAEVALGDVVESVPVTLTFVGKDLLKKNPLHTDWSVAANTKAVENFDITLTVGGLEAKEDLYVEGDVIYTGIENLEVEADASYFFDAKSFGLDVTATYTAEKYEATGEVLLAFGNSNVLFSLGASVESDKLVEGATLKAELAGASFGGTVLEDYFEISAAALTLSCKVEF